SRIFYEEDNSLLQGAVTVHWQSRGDKWVLDGELPALLMSEETGYHLVFATEATTSGLKVFLVPTKETGVSVRSKAPVSEDGSVVLAKVALSRVELSSGSCLGDFAPARAATLVLENRILATCRINGRVRAILDGVIEYLKARE